jgi:hypothetical protein
MAEFSLTNVSNLFKIKYAKVSENVYNSYNVTLGRVQKSYDFVGRQIFKPIPQSFQGGVGSGTLPTPNYESVEDAIVTAKKVYATTQIDRETIKAASNDEGSFVRQTKHCVQKTVESYMRNCSRILFNGFDATTNTGSIACGDGSTNVTGAGTTGSPYLVTLGSTTVEAAIEEKDYWNYNAETTLLEVVAYNPTTRVVSLVGTSAGLAALVAAPGPMLSTVYFYMQGSRGNDPIGLKAILRATTGTLYTISVGRRWQAGQLVNASGAGITTDMLNLDMLEIERKCGKVPNMIVTSFTQYRKILNLLEDKKQYSLPARAADLKGLVSFKGVEFMSSAGPIGIFPERFCDADSIYYLNDNFIELLHRPGFGWFDDDGTVFLRGSGDYYEARYGGYWEMYCAPNFHGTRHGLAT